MSIIVEANSLRFKAFSAFDVRIKPNTITAILGPTASSKSDLLQLFAGLNRPDSGTVTLLGKDTATLNESEALTLRKRAAYVLPNATLVSNHTIVQNVSLPLVYHRVCARAEADQRAQAMLASLGYQGELNVLPSALTEQQKRIVNISRNLMLRPDVLFVDEAFAYLDALSKQNFIGLYQSLRQQALTLILATHEAHAAKQCADQFIFMANHDILFFDNWLALANASNNDVQQYLHAESNAETSRQ